MPAFSDSTLAVCGMNTISSACASISFGTPAPSLPMTNATDWRRSTSEIAVPLCDDVASTRTPRDLISGSAAREFHLHHGHPKERSRRGAHRLPVPRAHSSLAEQQAGHSKGLGRAGDRAQIAGILQTGRDHQQSGLGPQDILQRTRPSRGPEPRLPEAFPWERRWQRRHRAAAGLRYATTVAAAACAPARVPTR